MATLAFPAISTGVYGYPMDRAAKIAVASVRSAALEHTGLREVIFCCYSAGDLAIYAELLDPTSAL